MDIIAGLRQLYACLTVLSETVKKRVDINVVEKPVESVKKSAKLIAMRFTARCDGLRKQLCFRAYRYACRKVPLVKPKSDYLDFSWEWKVFPNGISFKKLTAMRQGSGSVVKKGNFNAVFHCDCG